MGIKTGCQNINSLRSADGTILLAESKVELDKLTVKVKLETKKSGLTLNIKN